MAEGVFKHLLKERELEKLIECDSCGTSGYHIGHPPDHRASAELRKYGIEFEHEGRQLSLADFYDYDLILAMDSSNYENILREMPSGEIRATVKKMRHYDPDPEHGDVPDPYYGGVQGFTQVYDMLKRSCEKLLESIPPKK